MKALRNVCTIAIAVLTLAACAGTSQSGPPASQSGPPASQSGPPASQSGPPASQSGHETLTFSNWQWNDPGRGEQLKKLVDTYNSSQSDITINLINVAFTSYPQTITTQMGAGSGPDIANLGTDVFYQIVKAGLAVDLTDAIANQNFSSQDRYNIVNGHRYGVTWEGVNYALICNQSLLDSAGLKAPTTYDQFHAAAAALTKGTQQFGFAYRQTMPQASGWWFDLSNWVYGFGGAWTDDQGNPTVNSPKVIQAVAAYASFFTEGLVPKGVDAATYRQMFADGKVAMIMESPNQVGVTITQNPKMDGHITVVPNPFPTLGNAAVYESLVVNKASKHVQAAEKFLNWLMQPSIQTQLGAALGGSNVALSVDLPTSVLDKLPWLTEYAKSAPSSMLVSPVGQETQTAVFRNTVLPELDKVLRSGADPQQAMDAAQAALKQALGK
jgi:multiple sugar transport system substrate-binding protein